METTFSNMNTKIVPTDGTKLMRRDLVSQVKCIQMGSNSHLSTCVEEKTVPSKVDIDVVPATTSPMPKSEWKEKYFLKEIK